MKRLKLFTVLGAIAGASFAAHTWFQQYTAKTNWHSAGGMRYITAQDAAIASGVGAMGGGLAGVVLDELAVLLLSRQMSKAVRKRLLELRESEGLGDAEREAIDLTLSQLETRA